MTTPNKEIPTRQQRKGKVALMKTTKIQNNLSLNKGVSERTIIVEQTSERVDAH